MKPSLAPSMDIQIASNFERLLFYFLNGDASKVNEVMRIFRENGRYCFENFDISGFSSVSASDGEIPNLIQMVKREYDYLVDPHTACAFKDLDPEKRAVILATAHPAKFPAVYMESGMEIHFSNSLEKLKDRESRSYLVQVDTSSIRSFILDRISEK